MKKSFPGFIYIYIYNHKNNVQVEREREREREKEREREREIVDSFFMPTNSLCPSFISCKLT